MKRFTIPMKLYNWNDIIKHNRANKYYANKKKQDEMNKISKYINIEPITKYPIKIIFKWHIKSKITDLDNRCEKNILDCMQKIGVLENDNIKYINEITHIAISDKEDYIEIEIL